MKALLRAVLEHTVLTGVFFASIPIALYLTSLMPFDLSGASLILTLLGMFAASVFVLWRTCLIVAGWIGR